MLARHSLVILSDCTLSTNCCTLESLYHIEAFMGSRALVRPPDHRWQHVALQTTHCKDLIPLFPRVLNSSFLFKKFNSALITTYTHLFSSFYDLSPPLTMGDKVSELNLKQIPEENLQAVDPPVPSPVSRPKESVRPKGENCPSKNRSRDVDRPSQMRSSVKDSR